MQGITIRGYLPKDYQGILSLWEETSLGGAHRGDNQQIIEQSIEMGGELLVAVDSNEQIVGTSWITFDVRRLHLHHFGVKPSYQRRGIGKRLTIESLRIAKVKGYQIKLEVHRHNEGAINLYKKLGFEYLGDFDVYIIRDVKSLIL